MAELLLTLKDLALILDTTRDIPDETAGRLAPFVRSDPRVKEQIAELEHLADEAGIDPDDPSRPFAGFESSEQFRRLLQARGPWTHPNEVLGPDVQVEISELLSIAKSRGAKTKNPIFREVELKLERAAEHERAAVAVTSAFVEKLLALPEDRARDLINEAGMALQRRRQEKRK